MDDAESMYERGAARMRAVYAGEVAVRPEGTSAFSDVMMKTLFAEVWARDVLPIRDRRLLIMGTAAAHGAVDTWRIHARAALRNAEVTVDELREALIMLAPYAGYPNVTQLLLPCEEVIEAFEDESHGG